MTIKCFAQPRVVEGDGTLASLMPPRHPSRPLLERREGRHLEREELPDAPIPLRGRLHSAPERLGSLVAMSLDPASRIHGESSQSISGSSSTIGG